MRRRGLIALWGLALLAACEPATEAQRLAVHWQACQNGLAPARLAGCTQVIDAPNVTLAQRVAALVARGALRVQLNQDERALSDFGQALRFDAQNTDALIERGKLHQKHGAFGEAIADFDAADRINRASGGGDYRQDAIAAEVNVYRAQIAQLDGQIAADEKSPSLYNNRCWLRAIVGEDLNGALSDCNTSLALAPNVPAVLDSRGLAELKLGAFQAAFEDYDAAVAADPDNAHYLFGRGLARAAAAAIPAALVDLGRARTLEPGIDGLYESYGIRTLTGVLAQN